MGSKSRFFRFNGPFGHYYQKIYTFFAYYYSSSYSLHKNIDLIHFEKLPLIVRVSETFFICLACEIGRIWPRNSKTAHTIFFIFLKFLAKNKQNEIKETISGAL